MFRLGRSARRGRLGGARSIHPFSAAAAVAGAAAALVWCATGGALVNGDAVLASVDARHGDGGFATFTQMLFYPYRGFYDTPGRVVRVRAPLGLAFRAGHGLCGATFSAEGTLGWPIVINSSPPFAGGCSALEPETLTTRAAGTGRGRSLGSKRTFWFWITVS
jgi:hypothetical protein